MNASVVRPDSTPKVAGALREVLHVQELFDETLARLDERDLQGDSLLPGWTRAHVVAHVAYNARALTRLVDWAATGTRNPMYESRATRDAEIETGSHLAAEELVRLSTTEALGLAAAWSALPEDRWDYQVRDGRDSPLAIKDALSLRSREVWMHLIDLDAGIATDDVPETIQRRILQEVLDAWAARDHFVSATSIDDQRTHYPWSSTDCGSGVRDTDLKVFGTLADLLAWSTGRSTSGITAADFRGHPLEVAPPAKRWL